MSLLNKKTVVKERLRGERLVTIRYHKLIQDEKGTRLQIRLELPTGDSYDYYVFPNPEKDGVYNQDGRLEKSQYNYLLEVFAGIADMHGEMELEDALDKLVRDKTTFVANFQYNPEYNRNNISFYEYIADEESVPEDVL